MSTGGGAGLRGYGMQSGPSQPVVHLELHTGDLSGARAFYDQLRGWNAERIHASAGSYLALDLGRGEVGGGIVECAASRPVWLPYVEVPSVEAVTEQAREPGGAVVV